MMNSDFQRMMSRAAVQTREGDVLGATRTIQEALSGGSKAGADLQDGDVIDVEARVIEDRQVGMDVADELRPQRPALEPEPQPSEPEPVAGEERFIAGTYARDRVAIDYKLYVPPGDLSVARPLLVMLHGCTQDPDDFAAGTRMNEVARQQGWLVLYPQQSTKHNPQGCWNWFKTSHQQRGRGEPAQIAALTRHIMETQRVDARHVHVAGLSAGGAMAAVLGQVYPELFASVGVHSGLPCGAVSNVAEAMNMMRTGQDARPAGHAEARQGPMAPMIIFHGTRDMTVHPLNGEHLYADATAGLQVTERVENGREGGRAYTRKTSTAADGRSVAELWLIEGGGHAWSGGDVRGSYADWQGPDAAGQMMCFFSAHPRKGEA